MSHLFAVISSSTFLPRKSCCFRLCNHRKWRSVRWPTALTLCDRWSCRFDTRHLVVCCFIVTAKPQVTFNLKALTVLRFIVVAAENVISHRRVVSKRSNKWANVCEFQVMFLHRYSGRDEAWNPILRDASQASIVVQM